MSECAEILEKLLDGAELFMEFIKPPRGEMKICAELADIGETATLLLGDKPQVIDGCIEGSDGKVSMKKQVLKSTLEGKADAFALAARARMDEERPIEFEIYKKEHMKEIWEVGKWLLTYFFVPGKIKINLGSLNLLATLIAPIRFH